jgi:hypothetical protein
MNSIFKVYQIENDDVQFNLQINLNNEKHFKCNLQFKNKLEIDGFPSVNPIFSLETDDVNENKVKITFNMTHEIMNLQYETPESQFIKSDNTCTESNIEYDESNSLESNPPDSNPSESTTEYDVESNPPETTTEYDVESNPPESTTEYDVESNPPETTTESNVVSEVPQNLNSEIILSREEELDNISEEFRNEIDKKFNHHEDNGNKQLVDVITNLNKHLDYIMLKLESGEKFGNQITESDQEIKSPHPHKKIKSNSHKKIKPHPTQEIKPHPTQEIKPHPPQEIKPHLPQEIKPHTHEEIENIPNHKKKINDVINEIQKSDLCKNVENNLIEIIIKHMTSIEGYNIIGEEKKNLVLNSIESMLLTNDNKNKNILLILSSKLIDTFIAFDKHKINIEDRNNYLSCFGCR